MPRYDFWATQRESAQILENGLKVRKSESNGRFDLEMWMPKATKPFANYYFRTEEAREAYIAKAVANYDAHQASKAQYKKDRATGDPSLADVGAIFKNSWGYDQTNVDYYEVVERRGLMVTIAKIAQETVPGSEGFMCEQVRPAPGAFIYKCAATVTNEYGTHTCGCYKSHHSHSENCGAFDHKFVPKRVELKKKLQFWNGEPSLSFEHGSGSLVKVTRFGNADPLIVSSDYQSHYA